jgi:hypothetical protein
MCCKIDTNDGRLILIEICFMKYYSVTMPILYEALTFITLNHALYNRFYKERFIIDWTVYSPLKRSFLRFTARRFENHAIKTLNQSPGSSPLARSKHVTGVANALNPVGEKAAESLFLSAESPGRARSSKTDPSFFAAEFSW